MTYLNGRVDPMEPATIALNIINGNRNDAREQILSHAHDGAELGCVVLLVLDELISRVGHDASPAECNDQLYRLLEVAVGQSDTHRPAPLRLVATDE